MKFYKYQTDLQILCESEAEKQKLFDYCEANQFSIKSCFSDVRGQDWFGKKFYELPFLACKQSEIEKFVEA